MEQGHEQQVQENPVFCQSCGMPMSNAEVLGTDRKGEKILDYCIYCYEAGEFKQPAISLQEMITLCSGYLVEEGMDEAAARKLLADQLPHLKRWSITTGSSEGVH